MKKSTFDYSGAKEAGYSDQEIGEYLIDLHPKFDYKGALESGYSPEEVNEYLSSYKPQKSKLEKGARIAGQLAIGAAESALLPYELAVAPLAIPGGQEAMGDLFTREVLSEVYPTEEEGKNVEPRELKEPIDIGTRGLLEKTTGVDLHPEGIAEKAASWIGLMKDPSKIVKAGLNPKQLIKAISPTGKEGLRGLGAGAALQMAEEGQFGPIGTLASAVVGDLAGGGLAGMGKALISPKKTLAKGFSLLASKPKIKSDMIEAAREAGYTKDLGTLTGNPMVQMVQARLSASGLTGEPLEKLRKQITKEVVDDYKSIADSLGQAKFESLHEAGLAAKEGIQRIRDVDLAETRTLYDRADKSLTDTSIVLPKSLAAEIDRIEKKIKPGTIKSTEQQAVINALDKVKQDIYTPSGNMKMASVKDLMNDKIALTDIINYEVQGGAKQLLKGVVKELDRAIISHGKENIQFAKNYIQANKRFSQHAKTFRNKVVDQLLRTEDPSIIMNKMNSVQGIQDLKKVLSKTKEGKDTFDALARSKLDQILGKNLEDGVSNQLKSGKFSHILEKGKNREIVKELLPPESFKRLQTLQKHVGELYETSQKFFNASQSATAAADMTLIATMLTGVASMFGGNAWGVLPIAATFSSRQLSKLISDPAFLRMVEDSMLAAKKNDVAMMDHLTKMMMQKIQEVMPKSILEVSSQSTKE